MKKLFTILMLIVAGNTFAQRGTGEFTVHLNNNIDLFSRNDTVAPPAVFLGCIPNLSIGLLTLSTDQVSGLNSFGDKEKAQHFGYPGGGDVIGVMVYYGLKKQGAVGGTSNYTVKIYNTSSTGPNAFLGTSQPVNYSAIDTTGAITLFNFSSPVTVVDSFYASVVVDPGIAGSDTTAVLMVFDGSNPTNACGNSTAWERQSDNSWHRMNGSLSTEWGVDVQFLILPIISGGTAGVDEISPVATHKIYPNPSNDFVNISYSLHKSTDVKINLIDINGKLLYSQIIPNQISGAHNQLFDVSGFSSGIYTYQLETGAHFITGKFLVQ